MNYTVSANGRRLEVMDDSETVSYTTSGLVYGEVQVSAINTCGQESQPATINITAEGELEIRKTFACQQSEHSSLQLYTNYM